MFVVFVVVYILVFCCLQDVIFAVPRDFYEAAGIDDGERFLDSCDFIGGSLGWVMMSLLIM